MYQALLAQSGFSMERLASFCAVADTGSIAKAARGDSNTASLISRQIRELETFFAVELVRRKGRGLELTEAGLELAAIGRRNFKGIADFAARCKSEEWTARIVASNSVAQWLLLPALDRIQKEAGAVRFEIHHEQTREMVAMTREGVFDLAFVRNDSLVPGLEQARLGTVRHSLFIPRQLAKTSPTNVAGALGKLPLALPIGGRMRECIGTLAARAGVIPRIAVECSSYLQAAELVRSGACAAALPDYARPALGKATFHQLPLGETHILCLAWTARNVETRPAMAKLIEVIRRTLVVS